MRYYIVDKNGNVCEDFRSYEDAQDHLANDYTQDQVEQDELEIIDAN